MLRRHCHGALAHHGKIASFHINNSVQSNLNIEDASYQLNVIDVEERLFRWFSADVSECQIVFGLTFLCSHLVDHPENFSFDGFSMHAQSHRCSEPLWCRIWRSSARI